MYISSQSVSGLFLVSTLSSAKPGSVGGFVSGSSRLQFAGKSGPPTTANQTVGKTADGAVHPTGKIGKVPNPVLKLLAKIWRLEPECSAGIALGLTH